jgi:hypothetical protein
MPARYLGHWCGRRPAPTESWKGKAPGQECQRGFQVKRGPRAQLLPQFKLVAPDREDVSGGRGLPVMALIGRQYGRRCQSVRGEAVVRERGDGRELKRVLAGDAGVDEHHFLPPRHIQQVFHLQLEVGEEFHVRQLQGLQAFDGEWTQRIVAAAGVADADDQTAGAGQRKPS